MVSCGDQVIDLVFGITAGAHLDEIVLQRSHELESTRCGQSYELIDQKAKCSPPHCPLPPVGVACNAEWGWRGSLRSREELLP